MKLKHVGILIHGNIYPSIYGTHLFLYANLLSGLSLLLELSVSYRLHTGTPLSYSSISQMTFLSYYDPQFYTCTAVLIGTRCTPSQLLCQNVRYSIILTSLSRFLGCCTESYCKQSGKGLRLRDIRSQWQRELHQPTFLEL